MPFSKDQRTAACIAYNCKRGKIPKSKLKGASLDMYNSMSLEELREFCKGPMEKPKRQG